MRTPDGGHHCEENFIATRSNPHKKSLFWRIIIPHSFLNILKLGSLAPLLHRHRVNIRYSKAELSRCFSELTVQMAEWATFFIEQKAEIIRLWLGPFPVIVAFSAECTKVGACTLPCRKTNFQQILESTTQLTKGPEYDIMKRWLGTGLLTR